MARVFGYLMQEDAIVEDEAIFEDVSTTIHNALRDVYAIENRTNLITFKAYTNALKLLI
jgi:hypothetical protein